MQKGAQFISDTYLALFLAQLANEGYYIFVVRGNLPECEADQVLSLCPYVPSSLDSTTKSKSTTHNWVRHLLCVITKIDLGEGPFPLPLWGVQWAGSGQDRHQCLCIIQRWEIYLFALFNWKPGIAFYLLLFPTIFLKLLTLRAT